MKPERLFKTKAEIARSLPIGTWFVWPGPLPQQYAYYRPKIHWVEANHHPGPAIHIEIGVWGATDGPYFPQAVYERMLAIAGTLNAQHADEAAARVYLQELTQQRQPKAINRLPDRWR